MADFPPKHVGVKEIYVCVH